MQPDHNRQVAVRKVLALEFGGTHIVCAAVCEDKILEEITMQSSEGTLLAEALKPVTRHLKAFTEKYGVFDGIGMGFCGIVDRTSGRISSTNGKYADGTGIDLPSWAHTEFGLPFRIENDVRLSLLGEHYAGAARGRDNVVLMTVGTGIGTAAILEGRLLRGSHSQAGILGGHVKIPGSQYLCSCGGTGCYEALGSTFSLPFLSAGWPGFHASLLNNGEKLDFARLFACADYGDTVAQEIRAYCLQVWSACAISLIHAYDPERLVLGGGVFKNSFPILASICQEIRRQAWTPWGQVEVVPMQHGHNAAILGSVPLFGEPL